MPKKSKGGKGQKRARNQVSTAKRELPLASDDAENKDQYRYGYVEKMLGNGRMQVMCFDGVKRLAHIPGRMHRKTRIAQGDILLLGLREYQDSKCEVIVRYTPDEARELKARKEIPADAKINETGIDEEEDEGDVGIEFGDEEEDEEEEKEEITLDDL